MKGRVNRHQQNNNARRETFTPASASNYEPRVIGQPSKLEVCLMTTKNLEVMKQQ